MLCIYYYNSLKGKKKDLFVHKIVVFPGQLLFSLKFPF